MNERLLFSSYYLSDPRRSIAVLLIVVALCVVPLTAYASDPPVTDDVYLLRLYAGRGPFSEAYGAASGIAARGDAGELASAIRVFHEATLGLRAHERLNILRVLAEGAFTVLRRGDAVEPSLGESLRRFQDTVATMPSGLREVLLRTGAITRTDSTWRLSLQREGHRIARELDEHAGRLPVDEAAGVIAWLEAVEMLPERVFLRVTVLIEQTSRNRDVVIAAREARARIEASIDSSTAAD
ncbi:MAG: hypothetical protein ACOC4I_05265 [Spirochaetota bacterium]